MATFRELLNRTKAAITEVDTAGAEGRLGEAVFLDVREPDEYSQGTIPGSIHIPRGQLETNVEGRITDHDAEVVVYCAGGTRSAFAAQDHAGARLHQRGVDGRRVQPLERRGPVVEGAAVPHRRAAQPLPAPPPPPRGRRSRPAQAARVEGAAPGAGGLGSPGGPLSGRRRRRHPGSHRHGRGRCLQPPTPDSPQHGPDRRPEGRLGQEDHHPAQPGRQRRHLRHPAGSRQRPRHHPRATT